MGGAGRRTALWIAVVLAIAAPLPFGAVGPGARTGLALALSVGLALLWLDRRTLARPPLRFCALTAGTAALAALYFVPAPPSVVRAVSPRLAAEARESLAFPGEAPGLAAAERALCQLAGGARVEGEWRPLIADVDGGIEGVTRLLLALGAFALALFAAGQNGADRRRIAAAVGLSAFAQAAYGLGETLSGSQSIFGWRNPYYPGLASGTFVCPNHVAALLSLGLLAVLGLVAGAPAPPQGDAPDRAGRTARNVVVISSAGLVLVAMLWSSSRAALACAAAGVLIFGATLTFRRDIAAPRRWRLLLALGVLATLVLGAVFVRPVAPLAADVAQIQPGLNARIQLWRTATDMAQAFPATGVGPGAYDAVHRLFQPLSLAQPAVHAHSDFLEWWAEMGAPGVVLLLLWLAALGWGGVEVIRRGRDRALTLALAAALGALALHETVDFSLQLPGLAVPAALLAGALLAPLPLRAAAAPERRWRGRAWPILLGALAASLLVAALVTVVADRDLPAGPQNNLPRLATPEQLRRWAALETEVVVAGVRVGEPVAPSQVRRIAGAYRAAQAAARRAPLRGEARITCWVAAQALAALRAPASPPEGFDALSAAYLERAIALDPANRRRRLQVAQCWTAKGEPAQARRTIHGLLDLDPDRAAQAYEVLGGAALELADLMEATPNQPRAALNLANYLLVRRRDPAGALLVVERAVTRSPGSQELARLFAGLLSDRGRNEEALAALEGVGRSPDAGEERATLLVRARLQANLRRFADLEATLGKLAALGEDPRLVAQARALGESARGNGAAAIAQLEAALAAQGPPLPDQRRLEILLALAREQQRSGRFRDALASYRRAAAIDPDQPEVRDFLARLDPATRPGG